MRSGAIIRPGRAEETAVVYVRAARDGLSFAPAGAIHNNDRCPRVALACAALRLRFTRGYTPTPLRGESNGGSRRDDPDRARYHSPMDYQQYYDSAHAAAKVFEAGDYDGALSHFL